MADGHRSPREMLPPVNAIPRTVWMLGLVSLSMDLSSEIIHALLPLFLTTVLGVSVAAVGVIDGVAEATASITKVFSGYLSDRIGKRRPLILFGYGLAAVTKPLFALAVSPALVLGARFSDRIGKGLRGAPRDALIADVTPVSIRGAAFGLRQSLDTVGAFVGPLVAIGLMLLFKNDTRIVFWFATIPAAIAVLLVLVGVRDAERVGGNATARAPIRLTDLRQLSRPFWTITLIGVVFTLARFSEAFLILRAHAAGLPIALAPLVLVAMNLVYAIGAYPAGKLSDRQPPRALLAAGITCLILSDLTLASSSSLAGTFLGIGLWGVHMALTQGLFAKLVADHAAPPLVGSAYGIFNLFTGVTLLFASVIAGLVWDRHGAEATFLLGAAFALSAMLLLFLTVRAGSFRTPDPGE
jgi:MFS family permease